MEHFQSTGLPELYGPPILMAIFGQVVGTR
jgi:hypothetical protein